MPGLCSRGTGPFGDSDRLLAPLFVAWFDGIRVPVLAANGPDNFIT
jgi:hypothetical protein